MGIKIHFLDGEEPRDVKDVQAALLIQETLRILEIQFEKIMITNTDSDNNEIHGVDLSKWT